MRYGVDRVAAFVTELFHKIGLRKKDARLVSDSLLYAEQRGIRSHGLIRIPYYARRIIKGGTNARPRMKIIKESGACALIDGDDGMGQVSGAFAMKAAMRLAGRYGVSHVCVRNGGHFGAAGYFTTMASAKNLIGIATSNTSAVMAPTGGTKRMVGNNPLSVAVPCAGDYPIVLDMAMSVSSLGKSVVAAQRGDPIPAGWALDENGKPTTDPQAALAGSALPFGGYKGYGLALMLDILGGVLSGGAFGPDVGSLLSGDPATANGNAFAFLAIKPGSFMPVREFKKRVTRMADRIRRSPRSAGTKRIYLPGEIEYLHYHKNRDKPITISNRLAAELNDIVPSLEL